tara:strand:+ start:378 stop:1169 length:792 start_codon:yes stop_codon:yes gene_type:complete
MEINKLINADCVETMGKWESDVIDLTVTSPPYDELRDYKGYDFDFRTVAKELFRVTKNGGVVVWVVGDSVVDGSETCTSFKQAMYFKEIGFNLHDTMIYQKKGASLPDPTRYFQSFEYMFVFSKGRPKTLNKIYDRQNVWTGKKSGNRVREKDGKTYWRKERTVEDVSYRGNIWEYLGGFMHTTGDEFAYKHPAMFPEGLAKDHILSWSNEGDLVLDPMCGSGTTCKMSKQNARNYIGIEISKEYLEIAERRMAQDVMMNYFE